MVNVEININEAQCNAEAETASLDTELELASRSGNGGLVGVYDGYFVATPGGAFRSVVTINNDGTCIVESARQSFETPTGTALGTLQAVAPTHGIWKKRGQTLSLKLLSLGQDNAGNSEERETNVEIALDRGKINTDSSATGSGSQTLLRYTSPTSDTPSLSTTIAGIAVHFHSKLSF